MAVDYIMAQRDFDFEHVHRLPASPPYYSYARKRQRLSNLDLDQYKMADYNYFHAQPTPPAEGEFDFDPALVSQTIEAQQDFAVFPGSSSVSDYSVSSVYDPGFAQQAHPYPQALDFQVPHESSWVSMPPSQPLVQDEFSSFPSYGETITYGQSPVSSGTSGMILSSIPSGYLSPVEPDRPRAARAGSLASTAESLRSHAQSQTSRSGSPNAGEMAKWGYKNGSGSWSCAFPGCSSRSTFTRGCDLRKHYKRHTKTLFCRHAGCPQATDGGFSSKKDRGRHEAKHNPDIVCEWDGCDRMFSRMDNMKDHVRRMHKREKAPSSQ